AAGFGKSALLSHWQQTQHEDYFIVYHCFSHRYEKTRSLAEAYCHLLKQLYLYYNIRNGDLTNDENRMRDILVGMLREPISAESKGLVIVLDGLDEADKTFEPFFTELPAGVFVIAAARSEEGDEPEYLRNWTDNAQRLNLNRLSPEAIPKWLKQISELAAYSEDNEFVKRLDKTTGGFPLYLHFLIDDLKKAAKKSQDVQAVLRNSPGGFKAYVREQFRLLAKVEEIKQQQEVKKLFALLSVALGGLSENDIQDLTNLDAWDLADLPWQATRWFSIQMGVYNFAHPLLADEFQCVLGRQADSAERNLIDYCAKWQDHHSAYVLRYYTEHLRDLQQWEKLYAIARDEAFFTTQRQKLPDEPDLPLKTLQLALWGKAKTDDVVGMAEFLLVHPQRLMQIAKESPLDILRAGSITRALALADKFYSQHRILWYLLLAWDLVINATQYKGKMEQALEILERLQKKDLRCLSESWMNDCAAYLLMELLVATKWTLTKLSKLILDDHGLVELCRNLAKKGKFAAAFDIAQQIDDSEYRAEVLTKIGDLQKNKIPARQLISRRIRKVTGTLLSRKSLAKAQAQAEKVTAALNTAQQIDSSYYRAEVLTEIAKVQPTPENVTAVLNTVQQIGSSDKQAEALIEIAKAQAQAENFAAALDTAKLIDFSYYRTKALMEIAKAQVEAKLSKQALLTAEQIFVNRNLHIPDIAVAFVENDDKENFKRLLIPCAYYRDAA
ncbi:MAG: hypothetical protein F6K21_34210, partial [Symploca sp. SIO2D2]|nr:hypothetical protein [Symploca sp. SIO2D2]